MPRTVPLLRPGASLLTVLQTFTSHTNSYRYGHPGSPVQLKLIFADISMGVNPKCKNKNSRVQIEPASWSGKHLAALNIRLHILRNWRPPKFRDTPTVKQLLRCAEGRIKPQVSEFPQQCSEVLRHIWHLISEIERVPKLRPLFRYNHFTVKKLLCFMAPSISERYQTGDSDG